MTDAIAAALDALDAQGVRYETTATDTIIEADSATAAFQAAQVAHDAVPGSRVVTSLEIDDDRTQHQGIAERVAAVERARQGRGGRGAAPAGQGARPPQERRAAPGGTHAGTPSGQYAAGTDAAAGGHPSDNRRYGDARPGVPTP